MVRKKCLCSGFSDIPVSLDEERKKIARQLQSVMLFRHTQQEVGDDLSIFDLNLQIV